MWSLLIATLPTRPSAVRLRVWRAVKASGCAALHDGAWLLPQAHEGAFERIVSDVRAHGGRAEVYTLAPRDDTQARALHALFDRSAEHAQWAGNAEQLQSALKDLTETVARRRLRTLGDALAALERIDFFPGAATERAQAMLASLRGAVGERFSGEPRPRGGTVGRRDPARYLGRRWTTRARPWVDRLACAWLVRRCIDPHARFHWFAPGAKPARGAVGFDYDGADFTHVGGLVSFEVMLQAFGFEGDASLRRLGALVHMLDVGGESVPEAPGLERILAGLRELHGDDDALLEAALPVFDAFRASLGKGA